MVSDLGKAVRKLANYFDIVAISEARLLFQFCCTVAFPSKNRMFASIAFTCLVSLISPLILCQIVFVIIKDNRNAARSANSVPITIAWYQYCTWTLLSTPPLRIHQGRAQPTPADPEGESDLIQLRVPSHALLTHPKGLSVLCPLA